MSTWNIGSIALHCYNSMDSIPSNVSGVILDLADQSRIKVSNWTGDAIGSNSINEKYQPSIIAFTMSELALRLQIQQGGIESSSIEGLSATRNYKEISAMWEKIANEQLRKLGKGNYYYKVLE